MLTLTWKDVLYPHGWIGDINKMYDCAKSIGYKYFVWNDRVYEMKGDTALPINGYSIANIK